MAHLNNTYLRSVNIDLISSDADVSFSDTHKVFHLAQEIQVPRNCHALIGLTSMNMVYSFYQFRAGVNNSFMLTVGVNSETITIDEGNYSITELIAHLNTKLTTAKTPLGLTTLTINANYNTNKIYFTTNTSAITISNILAWKELGYANSSAVAYASGTQHYAPLQFNLAGDPSIYIRLHNQQVVNINSKKIDGIVANVPVSSMYGEYIFYQPASEVQYFRSSLNLHKLEISILDENMQNISTLNSASPWRMTFTIHFSYNKDVILHSASDLLISNEEKNDSNNIDKKKA